MHVRVAWEIYHHQQKSGESKPPPNVAKDLLRPPSHLFGSSRPPPTHDLPPTFASHRPPAAYDQPPPPHPVGSLFSAPPTSHLKFAPATSPFTRYGSFASASQASGPPPPPPPNFGVSPLALGGLHHHDPWRGLQRTVPTFAASVNPLPPTLPGLAPPSPWTIKPDPNALLEREREEREREKLRREREERERREREEKQRQRLEQERREKERREMERREMERERERERERMLHQQRLESVKIGVPTIRERSPIRNGQPEMNEVRVKEEPRKDDDLLARSAEARYHHPFLRHPATTSRMLPPPPPLGHYGPPPPHSPHWPPPPAPSADFYHRYDPLRGYMDAMRVEEERCKLYNAYAAQQRKDLMHLRTAQQVAPPPAHKVVSTPPNTADPHKKEEPR